MDERGSGRSRSTPQLFSQKEQEYNSSKPEEGV